MNRIKTEFTIKDLENFSGIKAHTIRIWEKRYNLLNPQRTDSNIRYYNISDLLKLLNVSLLNANGYKISKIAELSDAKIKAAIQQFTTIGKNNNQVLNALKLAMLNFDREQFNKTYYSLLEKYSFKHIFLNIFMPFLNDLGLLWQVDSITPAHEHFISSLIQQKLFMHIEQAQKNALADKEKVYVLFLPDNEVHDLGLLYLNYELLTHGCYTVYLGQSVPFANLVDLQKVFPSIIFVGYFIVEPSQIKIQDYLDMLSKEVLQGTTSKLYAIGRKVKEIENKDIPSVYLFENAAKVLDQL